MLGEQRNPCRPWVGQVSGSGFRGHTPPSSGVAESQGEFRAPRGSRADFAFILVLSFHLSVLPELGPSLKLLQRWREEQNGLLSWG